MSQYLVNRTSLDEVTLEINQTGSAEATANLRVPLLDDKRSYVFCVDSLIAPLTNAPIFDLDIDTELFRIQRRNVGAQFNTNLNCGDVIDAGNVANVFGLYKVTHKIYDIPSLVMSLNNFAREFEYKQTLLGINQYIGRDYGAPQNVDPTVFGFDQAVIAPNNILPAWTAAEITNFGTHKFLNFKLLNDGTLVLHGTSDFWNNFFINFTAVGMETLGFAPETIPFTQLVENYNLMARTRLATGVVTPAIRVNAVAPFLAGLFTIAVGGGEPVPNDVINLAQMNSDYEIFSQHSLFQCADQRLKITVDSHLNIMNNVAINNEKESVDRSIAEFYFEKKIEASTVFNSDGRFESSKITTNVYSGEYSLIKKTSPYKKWTKLQTAYEVRFFRFILNIFYRKYNSVTTKWDIIKQRLGIPDDLYWSMLLRFVSEV